MKSFPFNKDESACFRVAAAKKCLITSVKTPTRVVNLLDKFYLLPAACNFLAIEMQIFPPDR